MGANGAGNVNLDGGSGFNPAAMMAGITLGGAVGQNIVGAMNGVLSGQGQTPIAPPPVPDTLYYIALDGQATGPYNLIKLKQMAISGQFTDNSLVWKTGMTTWANAGSIAELSALLSDVPPVPPIK